MPNMVGPAKVLLLGSISAAGVKTGVTTGTGQWFPRPGAGIITIVGESVGTGVTTGGTILIQEAVLNQAGVYVGTPSTVTTLTANDFTSTAQKGYHLSNSAYDGIRASINSDITGGGKVLVWMLSQAAG